MPAIRKDTFDRLIINNQETVPLTLDGEGGLKVPGGGGEKKQIDLFTQFDLMFAPRQAMTNIRKCMYPQILMMFYHGGIYIFLRIFWRF